MKLQAIPSSPLNLEGIGDSRRSRVTIRCKVPLVDTGGRVILVTAYGTIMSPLGGGDMAPMREAFPEVPASRLVTAAGEESQLMGQDNLSLFHQSRGELATPRCT
jgi:hypothetical protein